MMVVAVDPAVLCRGRERPLVLAPDLLLLLYKDPRRPQVGSGTGWDPESNSN